MAAGTASIEEATDFLEEVDEVARLIDGLRAGTISPQYIDSKVLPKHQEKHTQKQQKQAATAPPGRLPGPPKPQPGKAGTDRGQAAASQETQAEEEEAKRAALMEKVREMQANRERKLRARARYDQYVADSSRGPASIATDYAKWDLFCPEDEEDDLFNNMTPNNPAFKALERDMDERHQRMVQQRQLAERARVAGNAAFKAAQHAEALRCYEEGLATEKTNMALHTNAAQAALRLGCPVQAIEHCDKALAIADFLHNNPSHPLCAKAHARRAAAYRVLGQPERAAEDVAAALRIVPGDKELLALQGKVAVDVAEYRKQRELSKALKKQGSGTAAGLPAGLDVAKLGSVERLVRAMKAGLAAPGAPGAPASDMAAGPGGLHGARLPTQKPKQSPPARSPAAELAGLLSGDDAACVHFRECGGVAAAAQAVMANTTPGATHTAAALLEALQLLRAACSNEGNLLAAAKHKGLLLAVADVAVQAAHSQDVRAAAAALMRAASLAPEPRAALCEGLVAGAGARLGALTAALASSPAALLPALRDQLLFVLGNCAEEAGLRAALLRLVRAPEPGERFLAFLAACLASASAANSATSAVRAAQLITVMSRCPELRLAVAKHPSVVHTLAKAVVAAGVPAVVVAATAGALCALSTEPVVQASLAASGQLPTLLKTVVAAAGAAGAPSGEDDWLLTARAAVVLSRCMSHPGAGTQLAQAGALDAYSRLLSTCLAAQQHYTTGASTAPGSSPVNTAAAPLLTAITSALDAAVRGITILIGDAAGEEGERRAAEFVAVGGVPALRAVLAAPWASSATQGNAALCVSHLAKHTVVALPALAATAAAAAPEPQDADDCSGGVPSREQAEACLVAALLRVAYLGQGTALAKNAGIALARLASHPPLLARLKQLRGLEIIHATVKAP